MISQLPTNNSYNKVSSELVLMGLENDERDDAKTCL